MTDAPLALPALAPTGLALGPVASVMLWLGVLLAAVLVGGFALLFFRRNILDSGAPGASVGFDLRALREMRDRGEISESEYEAARAEIIGALSGAKPPAPPPTRDATPGTGETLRAEPGFDLTGEPLPDFSDDADPGDGPDEERPKK